MTHAHKAGHRRDVQLLELLDALLNRVTSGLCAGPSRELTELLVTSPRAAALRAWLNRHPETATNVPTCRIEGILCGIETDS